MRRAPHVLVICLAAIAAGACHGLVRPARPPYAVTGVVEAIDADALALRHKSGQRIRIALAPGTAVSRRNSPAAVADITVGMRIVVLYRIVDGTPIAGEVRLFRPAI
jgi:acyl-coenzyme A synthetase/AMP-(fatty) acid ligase